MRKLFTLIFTVVSLLGASAQYVCTTPGTVLKYSQTGEIEDSKKSSTTVTTLTSVEDKDGVQILTFTEDGSDEPNQFGNITLSTQVQYDAAKGTTTFIIKDAESMRQNVIDLIKFVEGDQPDGNSEMEELLNSIQAEGKLSVTLDPSAAVGSKLPDKSLRFAMGQMNTEMDFREGKFLGTETVEVPAGKFEDCLKVKFAFDASVNGFVQKLNITIYFAKGVGNVLYITADEDGDELVRQELTEFIPGK